MQDHRTLEHAEPELQHDDPAPFSEALHVPTLIEGERKRQAAPSRDRPAPLSDALQAPTLTGERASAEASAPAHDDPAPLSDALHIPTLVGETSVRKTSATQVAGGPRWAAPDEFESARRTTPAGAPRADAASAIGVPSNHPQTHLSQRLATLDKAALITAGIMTIGPLFAAMISRMG